MGDDVWAELSRPGGAAHNEVTKLAIRVQNGAKRLCPVDTGRLRSSIVYEVAATGRTITARIGTNVEYAGYVEFGTRHMRARPYLRPALAAVAS